MELVVSAVVGELVNRFISFLINRYTSEEQLGKKMKRLQDLLIRAHMVVEEAEVRYITNSNMLFQLKKLVEVMYQGYLVLDTIKYRTLCNSRVGNEVSTLDELSFTSSVKRLCSMKQCTSNNHELQITLDNLESAVSNMQEFVVLLGGCERMFRSPYDSYVYIDNFMFGRHVEKQLAINILLQENIPPSDPAVLPILGGSRVGKKSLVAHLCNNEKVRSKFPSILHMSSENIWRMEHKVLGITGRTLVVVEFTSDVDDESWLKFYSSVKRMGRGSKVIIISRIAELSRFGTVKPIRLNSLSHEEYRYLFKVLAFGSTNPEEHPQLALIAEDLAVTLGGSLITANVCAAIMRKNQNVHVWMSLLNRYRKVIEKNVSTSGEHPKNLMDKDHPIDIARFASSSSSSATLRLMPPHSEVEDSKTELPKVMFEDLIEGSAVLPRGEFELVAWESRIPPYKKFVNLATYCDDVPNSQQHMPSLSRKRKRLDK